MNKSLLRDGILGLHDQRDSLALYGMLEANPEATRLAMEVADDAFLIKLRSFLSSDDATSSRDNATPDRSRSDSNENTAE
ncbi:hypothetical protein [Rhodopirellula sp. SWK7]|uniref:hypothetical protein n=1 Tax=Rhodopirellula sp. SWK7 TaxID=595460 RepID=UPI0002BD2D4E|nr:hypothetical protein [Rhodopirellula sp. SWK7]EMI42728.1 hypothetical protein RRSWK_04917 [Rhodopirellula sp. SWK7]